MSFKTISGNLMPAAPAILGAALLIASPHTAPFIAAHITQDNTAVAIVEIALWVAAVIGFTLMALLSGTPRQIALRWTIALTIFVLLLFPQNEWDYYDGAKEIAASLGAVLLIAGLLIYRPLHPALSALDRLIAFHRFIPTWLFIGVLYVVFLSAAVALSWHCFHFYPIYTDTEGQYIHAKYLAMGHLYWPAPPLQYFYYIPMSVDDHGRWYSQYQPLHVIVLALGHVLHAPWMAGPTEGALTVLVTYLLARRTTGEGTARLAALLMLGCQMVLFMSASYMNHSTALLFTTLFLWAYAETLRAEGDLNKACRWGFMAGLAIGAVFLVRPLTAVGVALPFIFYSLMLMARDRKRWLEPMLAMAAGGLICLAFDGWYNFELTGDPLVMPYTKYSGSIESQVWFGREHTFWRGIEKTRGAWLLMNRSLFEWVIPCTVFVLIACLRPLKTPMLRLMLAMLFAYSAANVLNKWWSSVFGPRYLYETASVLVIFTAIGMRRTADMLQIWSLNAGARRGTVAVLVLLLFGISLGDRLPDNIRMYSHYFDDNPNFYYSLLSQSRKPALIFIGQTDNKKDRNAHYRWVTHANPPMESSPAIFATDLGLKEDGKLMAIYPGRHAYLERYGRLYPIDPETLTSDAPAGPKDTPQ